MGDSFTGVHAQRFSKTANFAGSKQGVALVLSNKSAKSTQQGLKSGVTKVGLSKCAKKGEAQLAKLLIATGQRGQQVLPHAVAKYKACLNSFTKPKVIQMTKRRAAKHAAKKTATTGEEEIN